MPNSNFTQTHRRLRLTTPLGKDNLLLVALQGEEAMSEPFSYQLTLYSNKADIKAQQLIGKPVTIDLASGTDTIKYFNGIVTEFGRDAFAQGNFYVYYAVVRPWLWLLTQREDCRIFQDKSLLDILKAVFKDYPNKQYDVSQLQTANYPKIPYCVQYHESDFHFISRLLEQYGVFYYFKQSEKQHSLILGDRTAAYAAGEKTPLKTYANQPGFTQITQWAHQYQITSGKMSFNAHNFTNPQANLLTSTDSLLPLSNTKFFERYRYQDQYGQTNTGKQLTRVAMESLEANYDIVYGKSNCRSLSVGSKIELDKKSFPNEADNSFVLTYLKFAVTDKSYRTTADKSVAYQNEFHCIPSKQIFRPPQVRLKPVSYGLQEAITTGPGSDEIYTDKYGRYKVYFYWDRNNKPDEKSSCWVRASQHWHGLFRVGTPVLVSFINGDIDRPIIVGPIDDAKQMPLYTLTENKTRSGIKRRPGKNGNDQHYNSIYFEDQKDKEKFDMYAGKDMQVTVENDFQADINHDAKTTIKNNRQVTLTEGNDTLTINKGALTIKVEKGTYVLQAKGNVSITSNGNISLKADGNLSLQAGKAVTVKSGSSTTLNATTAMTQKAGTTLDQSAGTNLTSKANAQLSIKSAMGNVDSSGILTLKGALIKEN